MVERKKGETWNENLIFRKNITTEYNDIPVASNLLLDFTVKSGNVYTATQNRSASAFLSTELSTVIDFYNTWIINFCGQIKTVIGYVPSEDGDGVVISKFTLDSSFDEEPATGANMRLVDPAAIIDTEQVVLKVDTEKQVQIGGENDVALIHNGIDPFGGETGLSKYDITEETSQFFVDIAKPVKTDSINVSTLCTPFSVFAALNDVWLTKVGIFLDSVPAGTKMRFFIEGDDTLNARYPLVENVTIDEFRQGLGDAVSVSTFADVSTWNLTLIKIPAILRIFSVFILNFTFSDSNGDPVFLDVPIDTSVTDSASFFDVREDVIQSASGTAITLDTDASPTDDDYNGMRLYIGGEFRNITAYNGTTKVATVASTYTTTPSASDPYEIKIAFLRPMMVFEHQVTVKSRIQDKHNRRNLSFSDDDTELEIGTVNYIDTTAGAPTFTIPQQILQFEGGWFEIVDKESNFDTNNVTIEFAAGDNFEGSASTNFVANGKDVRYLLRHVDISFGWTVEIINDKSTIVIDTTDSPYTLLDINRTIFADTALGDITINLSAGEAGRKITIINQGDNDVNISPNGSELLDGVNADKLFGGIVLDLVFIEEEGWW